MISPGLVACSLVSGAARERGSTGVLECWSVLFRPDSVRWWRSHLMSVVMFGCQHFVCLTLGTRPDWLFIVNIMLIIAGLEIHCC